MDDRVCNSVMVIDIYLFIVIFIFRCLACPGGKGTTEGDKPVIDDDLSYDDLDYGEEVDAQSV